MLLSHGCWLVSSVEGNLACCCLSSQSDLWEDSRKDYLLCQLRGILTVHLFVGSVLSHTGQCKRTGGCYNELVVAFYSTGGGLKGKKIYTCWLNYLFINLHLFYLWWHLVHRPPVTLQFMALPSNWWFNSWFGLQIQHSSGVLPWQVLFPSVTAKIEWNLHV